MGYALEDIYSLINGIFDRSLAVRVLDVVELKIQIY